ncbi:ABC transporter permease [Chitinasiproducens palmae]|uniref:Peptide/nickel transport system permease protein n=1 Tax=Chitinasiproducens palmae TaxID=1770053 RepID=A0A1H2PLF4_9BURK|nr:ABC transporter permease [Chitinasiproducens palmae]SDV46498.1 peptide/nickel transport system permease protein [Chitinasiproducens palmae]
MTRSVETATRAAPERASVAALDADRSPRLLPQSPPAQRAGARPTRASAGRRLRDALRYPLSSASFVTGFVLLLLIALAALFAGRLAGPDPLDMVAAPFLWPGQDAANPLGTDMMGRDMLAGIIYGARVSLQIGLLAGVLASVVGLLVGAASGYFGGWVDDVLMRVTEVFQTMPALLFTIVLVVVLQPTIASIVLGLSLTSWPQVARLVRADTLRLRHSEFVQAAVGLGMGDFAILRTHVLPNVLPAAVAMISLLAGNAILTEAVLAFLGLGDPNVVSWGSMIGSGREALRTAWYMTALPGAAVFVTVIALNLLGNGLNDLVNPRNRRRR